MENTSLANRKSLLDFTKENFETVIEKTLPNAWDEVKQEFTPDATYDENGYVVIGKNDDRIYLSEEPGRVEDFGQSEALNSTKVEIEGKQLYVNYV